jgi:hypothetical protein
MAMNAAPAASNLMAGPGDMLLDIMKVGMGQVMSGGGQSPGVLAQPGFDSRNAETPPTVARSAPLPARHPMGEAVIPFAHPGALGQPGVAPFGRTVFNALR